MTKKVGTVLVSVAAVVVCVLIATVVTYFMMRKDYSDNVPGHSTGGPPEIELVGVIPEKGFLMYDAFGKRKGEALGSGLGHVPLETEMHRRLVFKAPAPTNEEILIWEHAVTPANFATADWQRWKRRGTLRRVSLDETFIVDTTIPSKMMPAAIPAKDPSADRAPGSSAPTGNASGNSAPTNDSHGSSTPTGGAQGGNAPTSGAQTSNAPTDNAPKIRPERMEVKRIDYAMWFYTGVRGETAWTLRGPFHVGQFLAEGVNPGYKVRFTRDDLPEGAKGDCFQVQLWCKDADTQPVFVFDKSGRRYLPKRIMNRQHTTPWRTYTLGKLKYEDVAYITIAEKPRVRTWHNIAVRYRGRDVDGRKAYGKVLSKRLGIDMSVGQYAHFDSFDQVLEAVNVVRDKEVASAMKILERDEADGSLEVATLNGEARAKLLAAARKWAGDLDPIIEAWGVALGVRLAREEFLVEASRMLSSTDSSVANPAARALAAAGRGIAPGELKAAAKALIDIRMVERQDLIFRAICATDDPAVGPVLAEIAQDPRPHLWMSALKDKRTLDALPPTHEWSDDFKARFLVASNFDEDLDYVPDIAEAAKEMLGKLLSPSYATMSPEGCEIVLEEVVARFDRAEAQELIANFASGSAGFKRGEWLVGLAVSYLNRWNNIDIGAVGPDFDVQYAEFYDWDAVSVAVRQWRWGETPRQVPWRYKLRPEDLRVIFPDEKDAEKSVIGLYRSTAVARGMERKLVFRSERRLYGLSVVRLNMKSKWDVTVRTQELTLTAIIEGDSLPYEFKENSHVIAVIEKADSPESVLSGTDVFKKWREKPWAMR